MQVAASSTTQGDAGAGGAPGELGRFARYLAAAHGGIARAVAPARGPGWALQGIPAITAEPAACPAAARDGTAGDCLRVARVEARDASAAQGALGTLMRRPVAQPCLVAAGDGTDAEALQQALAVRHDVAFAGAGPHGEGTVGVLDSRAIPRRPAPAGFRVLAIVPARNEEDLLAGTLAYLVEEGLDPIVLDNWSSDRTADIARAAGVPVERFPACADSGSYDLAAMLDRVEEMAAHATRADWVVLHDADERRRSPWPGVTLRDALWHVSEEGYNCIDHVTLTFWPTDDAFVAGDDPERHFRHFEFSTHPGHFHQRRAWQQCAGRVALARSAGHDVDFPGRRVYPYKFLLKHYPIRTRAQALRKLRDRRARWNGAERAQGWHRQYEDIAAAEVVRDPAELLRFDAGFHRRYLLERLSGVGVFDAPPAWATAPAW